MHAELNDITTNYIDTGNSNFLPLVMIHGLTLNYHMWDPQIEILKHTYRIIAYDLRGHGKSGVGDGQYTFKQYAEDLIALLDHLKIRRAMLCGLSMGGAIALRTIEIYPERVSSLILCDTRSDADSNDTKYWRERTIQSIKKKGLELFADDFLRIVFAEQSFKEIPETIAFIRNMIVSTSPLGACGAFLAQAARTDTTPSLSKISVPTFIMVGEKDTLTPPSISQKMHEKISNSQLQIISNAAHMSNLENTEEFNRYLLKFLENVR